MGRSILRFDTADGPRYLEYSSVVDAPVTWGCTRKEFEAYYRKEYGESGMQDLASRLERADGKGSSSHLDKSIEDAICCNRAGRDESRLTLEQLIEFYCVARKGKPPMGKSWREIRAEQGEDV